MKDKIYMKRCLELAAMGLGKVSPNPMVGAVLVHQDKIIGEGYHQQYGYPHAEVMAIRSVPDEKKQLIPKSTLYISLEPCCHQGKTPPCTDLILEHNIRKVVIGCSDPDPKVKGKGIKVLEKSGCKIKRGVLEKEAWELNKRFFTFHIEKRPYIILKWAQTTDGFTAGKDNTPKWISNLFSRKLVHQWRSQEMAIMVGTNTALLDDPHLTVRDWKGDNPIRVLIDKDLKVPKRAKIFNKAAKTWVFTAKKKNSDNQVEYIKIDFKKKVLGQILDILYQRNMLSLLVEGGSYLHHSFIAADNWDEARIFISDDIFGEGVNAPGIKGKLISSNRIKEDALYIYKNI